MQMLAKIAVTLIALLHVYIMVLEMFLWTTPRGRRAFGNSVEKAETTKVLAANQGLYNGFLAAGLFWGLSLGASGNPSRRGRASPARDARRGCGRGASPPRRQER